jgi:hypothetical protein
MGATPQDTKIALKPESILIARFRCVEFRMMVSGLTDIATSAASPIAFRFSCLRKCSPPLGFVFQRREGTGCLSANRFCKEE